MEQELTSTIKDGFLQFAGAVLQSRALVDSRDCIKPSARQILYCMYTDNFIHSKPFQKTLKAIGSSFRMYIHGDASAEGIIMRAAQPFAMRYPLIEVEGSYGTLLSSSSWAAPRYTSSRLSPLGEYLFQDIKKDTIAEWRDNYDDTEQYPTVLPSKGFYNIVNGTYGIGVGASSSIPQYNLKELNEALIKLLWNPEIDFNEIYVCPDFCTGAILLNSDEVKESHKNGTGAACKLRSLIEYDEKDRCLVVKEIPYMVYTETICSQLEEIINGEDNPGIDRFNDLTGESPLIKIYLTKAANVNKVIRYLYKQTSLQSHYSINFTILENGRFPKTYGWKDLLQSHLNHEKEVYTRGYQFDLKKIQARLHIIEALLICAANIEEVVKTIKSSESPAAASLALQKNYLLDEVQAKAVLDMKLSRLAHLEVFKLENEKKELETEANRIETILSDESLLKKEIEKGLREVAEKFGDARRTQVMNLQTTDDEEVVEEKLINVGISNYNKIYSHLSSSLIAQKRGGVGNKMKMDNGEFLIDSLSLKTTDSLFLFSNMGRFFIYRASQLPIEEKVSLYSILALKEGEKICNIAPLNSADKYIYFVTKNGYVKKSLLSEYTNSTGRGAQGLALTDGDSVVSIFTMSSGPIGILTKKNHFIMFDSDSINPQGRTARGVIGIKLKEDDKVAGAAAQKDATEIVSISSSGLCSRTNIDEIPLTKRGGVGIQLQQGDELVDFKFLTKNEKEIIVGTNMTAIRFDKESIPLSKRGAKGVSAIKLKDNMKVIKISI